MSCTAVAPINIALVKYWGKKDEKLNTAINSSLSITINTEIFHTKSTVEILEDSEEHVLYINGIKENLDQHIRIIRVLNEAIKFGLNRYVKIDSYNSFPHSAGLASSASSFCALSLCLSKILNLNHQQTAYLARIGSGSSCRSIFGGIVLWNIDINEDGIDNIPIQLFSSSIWKDLRIIIIQLSGSQKSLSSKEAMNRSVRTSELLKYKTQEKLSEKHITLLRNAINMNNFDLFSEIIMKESNILHAVCQDTYPPIEPPYLNSNSHKIIEFVHKLNSCNNETICCYTFDAGPNPFIFCLHKNIKLFINSFLSIFTVLYPNKNTYNINYSNDIDLGYFNIEPIINLDKILNISIDENCKYENLSICKIGDGPYYIEN